MRPLIAVALTVILTPAAVPSQANSPDATYQQTRDWVVAALTEFGGYAHDGTVVIYKDVSMDGCQLRFTTLTTTRTGYSETETVVVSLDSIQSVQWGSMSNPSRGYVNFTSTNPISLNRRRSPTTGHESETAKLATTVAAIQLGKPGAANANVAQELDVAILHAADVCKVLRAKIGGKPPSASGS